MTVRHRDGIEIELSDGTRVVCDADEPDGDVNVVTHAHGDHYPDGEATVVCSPLTAALATARRDVPLHRTTDDRVELLPAGHVAGSRAALVTDPDGTRYLYTGDICTRSRFYLDGFEPPSADVLITEATYGDPEYVFPDHDTLVDDITSWLANVTSPVLLMGYALGRAQRLQLLASTAGCDRVLVTDAVRRVNETIEAHRDVCFNTAAYDDETTLEPGDALILPMTSGRIAWIDRLATETGAIKAGFSGWAVDSSFKFRSDYDTTFPLSDHCDFQELMAVVEAVDPDQAYTQHGAATTFAEQLTDAGYDATALRQNQRSLDEF
ncbi:MAG: mRNA 3'-end processing factor [Halorhabdus sp.]